MREAAAIIASHYTHLWNRRTAPRERNGGLAELILRAIQAGRLGMNLGIRVFALSLAFLPSPGDRGFAAPSAEDGAVHAQTRNVTYHFTESVSVRIVALTGALVPTAAGHWPVFDDKNSFNIRVDSARILVLPSDLAGVLNAYVFASRDAPLKNISISVEKGQLKIKGKLHSKGDIPFATVATLSSNSEAGCGCTPKRSVRFICR
jgi:hypothetical protein